MGGRQSISDLGCERPLHPLPDISGQMARHDYNDFALSNRKMNRAFEFELMA